MVSQYVWETTSDCDRVIRRRSRASGTTYQDNSTNSANATEAVSPWLAGSTVCGHP